ncbi:MAG TPA: ATP F0F1 synthase subunit B [Rhizomicrobium sp.]|jgi:F-type H+-transporting ATPase subunit b|nr:ATP F0F1 synthase subunit B [Rhizomicrobium sp.]
MELLREPEFWVAVGFVMVIALLLYVGVPKMVAGLLDTRAATIKAELDEARRLREEAAAVLRGYQDKAASAEREAEAIVSEARAEAERFAADARAALSRQIERRAQVAQDKIAQAEAAATAEIRKLAADAAAAAAERLIAARMDETKAAAMIEGSIKGLAAKLN